MCRTCSTYFLWLACICFIPCLSSWCLWTKILRKPRLSKLLMFETWFEWYDLHSLLFKCLGNLFENLENPLASSFLICQSPTKAIWWYFLKTIHTYAACFCIELCQIVVTLGRILFMLSWSRFTCTPYTPLLCFFEKLALYHPLIPQNKCSTICVGLSLSLVFVKKEEERHGLSKKNMDMNAQHVELRKNFIYLWNKIRLNARLIIINLRKLNKAN